MGESTNISWCHHTFNPWWGCFKISDECKLCYAAAFDHRLGGDHWDRTGPRKFFGDAHWKAPLKWSKAAENAGERRRVFCASMADVFAVWMTASGGKPTSYLSDEHHKMCHDCGTVVPLEPANDTPEVLVEIRAAEIQEENAVMGSAELQGWDIDAVQDAPATNAEWAGWLAREIWTHTDGES